MILQVSCLLAVMLAAGGGAAAAGNTVMLTPWCDNSMRVRVSPGSLPHGAKQSMKALSKTLADKNMTDLSGAMVARCTPRGTATPATPGKKAVHGNIGVLVAEDGSITISRVDTGKTLFTASPSFKYNGDGAGVGAATDLTADGDGWTTLPNKKLLHSCSGSEFGGGLGSAANTSECLAMIKASNLPVNYGIYQGQKAKGCFACDLTDRGDPSTYQYTTVENFTSFTGPALPVAGAGYFTSDLSITAGDKDEVVYGLGQGNWTGEGGCPAAGVAGARIVPLERNGQVVNLQQRKFHVSIPFVYSTAGYGFLFNMPGYGRVSIGAHGKGGAEWQASAALYLDFWVTVLPESTPPTPVNGGPIYKQYADATGHAPPLRENAMAFWQSRNRYKSSDIAVSIAEKYKALDLEVGVLVIDYKNQLHDGDFAPNPACYPSVSALSKQIKTTISATTMFSFWPEVVAASPEYPVLKARGCLINGALGGLVVDTTIPECRDFIWKTMLKPRYYDQGVDAYWLDETDGEGTAGGADGDYGYNTSYGPPAAYSNLWVNDWLSLYSDYVAAEPAQIEPPLVLTRGVWAGGQRHGIVLWSSDIHSSFEQLASQVPQGVHTSMSGIPWWTTDVGGYGCGYNQPNESPYMKELIVRWYQFGCFSPVFRTHGCRQGPSEPNTDVCAPQQRSCGFNEVWSYGNDTQAVLEKFVRFRTTMKPYIQELDKNVTATGVPTMRPLSYEFPSDAGCRHIDDQYMFGPKYLVAPVTVQNATTRAMYFPAGADWKHAFNGNVVKGGQKLTVDAPLDTIPVYERQ